MLDELHGKGQSPKAQATAPVEKPVAKVVPVAPATPAAKPAVNKAAPVSEQKAAPAPAKAAQGETTVRVDTKRLDQIMNMVGELVLVRNRLTSLGMTKEDEELTKAVSNLRCRYDRFARRGNENAYATDQKGFWSLSSRST